MDRTSASPMASSLRHVDNIVADWRGEQIRLFLCENIFFFGRDDICLAIGLLDRQVKGRILLQDFQRKN